MMSENKKHILKILISIGYLSFPSLLKAQTGNSKDSVNEIAGVIVNGIYKMNGVERLPDNKDGIIYTGQKNIVLVIDSMNSNTAQSSMREELGRVPGANITEAQYNGFPYSGIGVRGFNGTHSPINMNIRRGVRL